MLSAEQTLVRLQRVLAVALLALVGSTWRLWTPDTVFPQIPWFGWARHVPAPIDWAALAGLAAGCLILLFAAADSSLRRRGLWVLAGSLLVLLLPSQQRLQPWAYEFLLILVILGLSPPIHSLRLLRWLIASIYIYSAWSKVDVAFFDSQGEMLLEGLLASLRLDGVLLTDRATWFGIALFPAVELLIGIGLLIPRIRGGAVVGSYLMHAVLLLALGPLGLDHRPGVLIWNVYFVAQNLLLYRPIPELEARPHKDPAGDAPRWPGCIATSFAAAAIACPLLQPVGWFDVWPAWAVYSSRPAVVIMQVRDEQASELPSSLREFVGPPQALTEWRTVNLDAWSFASLNCPIYPEQRFRVAVIRALVDEGDLSDVRVVVHGPPNRWTGERDATVLTGGDLPRYWTGFRLNTVDRD